MLILVTGATGKVGRTLIDRLLADPGFGHARVRALCHNRGLPGSDRVEVVRGSIADRATVEAAVAGRQPRRPPRHLQGDARDRHGRDRQGPVLADRGVPREPDARRFVLIGGDAGVGHFHHRHDGPVTEATPHRAYPGCYALSKVLEEVMVAQAGIQYGLDWTLPARALDHGEGRLPPHPQLRRRRLRRPRLEDAGRPRGRRPLPARPARCRCCATPTARRSGATSCMSTTWSRRS